MHLSPQEKDKLLVVTAALLAERRLKRGLKLNHPEAIAWLSFQILEGARDGKTVSELMCDGTTWLCRDQVMEGIPELIEDGRTGILFEKGNHENLRKIITRLVHNSYLLNDIAKNAKESIHERSSLRKNARQRINLYNSLL